MKTWPMWELTENENFMIWDNYDQLTIMGRLINPDLLEVGDEVKCKMKSGKTACFMIKKINISNAVYFEAELMEVGYEEDVNINYLLDLNRVCREAEEKVVK